MLLTRYYKTTTYVHLTIYLVQPQGRNRMMQHNAHSHHVEELLIANFDFCLY
jgi:hypothetical protein